MSAKYRFSAFPANGCPLLATMSEDFFMALFAEVNGDPCNECPYRRGCEAYPKVVAAGSPPAMTLDGLADEHIGMLTMLTVLSAEFGPMVYMAVVMVTADSVLEPLAGGELWDRIMEIYQPAPDGSRYDVDRFKADITDMIGRLEAQARARGIMD